MMLFFLFSSFACFVSVVLVTSIVIDHGKGVKFDSLQLEILVRKVKRLIMIMIMKNLSAHIAIKCSNTSRRFVAIKLLCAAQSRNMIFVDMINPLIVLTR